MNCVQLLEIHPKMLRLFKIRNNKYINELENVVALYIIGLWATIHVTMTPISYETICIFKVTVNDISNIPQNYSRQPLATHY